MNETAGVGGPPNARSPLRNVAFYAGAIITGAFMVRLLGASWNTHFPASWPDAVFAKQGYLAVAAKSPFRPSYYFAFRPIGYPFLLWLFGRSSHLVVIAQTTIYCAAVIALCATALRVLRSRVVAIATVAIFVGIAMQAKYAMWNTQILSESLAISLGFITFTAWWRFAASPTKKRATLGWVCLIAFLLVRDAHVLPATVVIVPVALITAKLATSLGAEVRRTLAAGAIVVIFVAGYSYVATSASHRATLSMHNSVGVRILPDPELSKWFDAHGMPLDDALRTRTGKSGLEDTFYDSQAPEFAEYREWARGAGPRSLVIALVVLAPHYGDLMYQDLPGLLNGDVRFYDTQSVYERLPHELPAQLGGPTTRRGLTTWMVLAGGALVVSFVLARRLNRGLPLVVLGATALIHTMLELYLTWGGDPIEMPRHVIGALSRLSVILVMIIASAIDNAIVAARTPDNAPETTPEISGDSELEVNADA